jgi:nucleoid DNA-binding protein
MAVRFLPVETEITPTTVARNLKTNAKINIMQKEARNFRPNNTHSFLLK